MQMLRFTEEKVELENQASGLIDNWAGYKLIISGTFVQHKLCLMKKFGWAKP